MYSRDVLDPTKILSCLVANENDDNEVLHPKTKYTVRSSVFNIYFKSDWLPSKFKNKYLKRNKKKKHKILSKHSQLHHFSLDSAMFFMKLGEQQLGKPYTWAQNMCGLNFIMSSKAMSSSSNNELTQETVPVIVDKMNVRLKARYQLYRQVLQLEQQFYGNSSKSSTGGAGASSPSCILAQWSPITFVEYAERAQATIRFIDENLVTTNHLLYHAVLIRGPAKMECFVSVSPNFPTECPIWAITLNLNGSRLHPSNSNDIKVCKF